METTIENTATILVEDEEEEEEAGEMRGNREL